MTYQMALEQISSLLHFGSMPGLERITKLLEQMGNPQNRLRFVHVAGTNGKGSTCSLFSSVLTAAGYRTGLYISPYILDFRERMQIDGEMIPKEELSILVEEFMPLVRQMEADGEPITEFELITALAMEWFARKECNVVVLEVGLGGRFDATNIIPTPLVSVIAAISLDHTGVLGDTVEQIAFEKAGIIKEGGDTVLFPIQDEGVVPVIEQVAKERSNRLHMGDVSALTEVTSDLTGTRFVYQNTPVQMSLIGQHQVNNAATVLSGLKVLQEKGFAIPLSAIAEGFSKVHFPARLELLCNNPVFLLDGAHNPNGTAALAQALQKYLSGKKVIGIMGMLADKDSHAALQNLEGLFERVYTLTPPNPRAMQAEELAAVWTELGVSASAAKNPQEAIELALQAAGRDGAVVVCGSLYLASQVRPVALEILQKQGLST